MIQFFQKNIEPVKKLRTVELILLAILIIGSIASFGIGFSKVHSSVMLLIETRIKSLLLLIHMRNMKNWTATRLQLMSLRGQKVLTFILTIKM